MKEINNWKFYLYENDAGHEDFTKFGSDGYCIFIKQPEYENVFTVEQCQELYDWLGEVIPMIRENVNENRSDE